MSMKNKVTTALLVALTGTMLPFAAQAQTPLLNDIDYTDVWWNPQRSGWGMNLVQQQNAAYVSLHDYKTDGTPTWYVAPLTRRADGSFAGEVYRHASAPISAPLTTSQVSGTPVGNFVFTPTSPTWGTIVYTIDGQQGEQTVTRFTFVPEPLEIERGLWNSSLVLWRTSCSGPSSNGSEPSTLVEGEGVGNLSPVFTREWDTSIRMDLRLDDKCMLSGTLNPEGRFSQIDNALLACASGIPFEIPRPISAQVTVETSPSRFEVRWSTDEAPASSFRLSQALEGVCVQKGKAVFVNYPD